MLTRKHFIAIAEALRHSRPKGNGPEPIMTLLTAQWHADREFVADVLAHENPAFDRHRFIDWTEM